MSVIHVNRNNFNEVVMKSEKPVLLDFWASWCMPCRMQAPILDSVAAEVDSAVIGKINVDEDPELASRFSIVGIPTLVVMKDGKVVNRKSGVTMKQGLISMLEAAGA